MRILSIDLPQPSIGSRIPHGHFQSMTRLRDYGIAALLLTGAADALFFDTSGRSVGLSVPLFAAILTAAVAICHRRLLGRHLAPYALLLAFALLALIENVDGKSLTMAIACLACFALSVARRLPSASETPAALLRFVAVVPIALPCDIRQSRSARRRMARRGAGPLSGARTWLIWVMPLVLTVGFVLLLAAGNPILERWLARIDPMLLLEHVDPARILFWVLVAVFTWPFLRPRLRWSARSKVAAPPDMAAGVIEVVSFWSPLVYGRAAILRALVLFNAVFVVQTVLDAVYLWGGMELPEGVDYASYAHHGAYTLIATALLAAAFVLLALRPGTEAADDRRIRSLVYLWIGQNVVLVLSAMLRLDLYVDVYALTRWRLAAFVWMGIVATGLVLICVRIAWRRSNGWLVGANMAAVAFIFAGSCFVDADALIARFNVDHSREISGQGVRLDVPHLASLGPAAIPAIDRFLARVETTTPSTSGSPWDPIVARLGAIRVSLKEMHRTRSQDWRNWSFRGWRLSRYLEAGAVPATPTRSAPWSGGEPD